MLLLFFDILPLCGLSAISLKRPKIDGTNAGPLSDIECSGEGMLENS